MNLRHGPSSQRSLQVDGYSLIEQDWVPMISFGSLRANEMFPSRTDYSVKKRVLACSWDMPIPEEYSVVRVDGLEYIVASEQRNSWRGGAYQFVYQLRHAEYSAKVMEQAPVLAASGIVTGTNKVEVAETICDMVGAGITGSDEIEGAAVNRLTIYFPGNIPVDTDNQLVIGGEIYDITSVSPFSRLQVLTAIRLGAY